ncbi:MAG: porphobilinogen synthase [Chitinophagales bacterium]|jgi:porphobilinogen synthase|nr:porphobilinogen synthase [Chitinophagales bacterium]HNL07963.1 porphobilinogen synthase [Chitinophagales bacterium]
MTNLHLLHRPRRLRKNSIVRNMVAETHLSKDMLMYPYFVMKGKGIQNPIAAMPGIDHFSPDTLVRDIEPLLKRGINKILLFGVGDTKSDMADSAYNDNSAVPTALRLLKATFGNDLYVATDVCVCAYTTHGHCGVLAHDHILNDESVVLLGKMALTHAQAGADMVAPSDMMDGRVGHIRHVLDNAGYSETALMAYSIKYASAYYGPFREAADSAPQKGDRKGYQMDFRNPNESMREAMLDENEGADVLMVKPALAYLDIIHQLRQQTHLPVACYNVSGEYSMLKLAAQHQLINEQNLVMENMYAFARAGANIIITYHAKDIVLQEWL